MHQIEAVIEPLAPRFSWITRLALANRLANLAAVVE
ncbi:MAG: hypothetical protein QOK11_580 [Pseudonocardiales bacterium]|nr:hypothetical protein [Pseudonocardiales bacterium]